MSDTADMQRSIESAPAIAIIWFGQYVMESELISKDFTYINVWGHA